MAPSVPELPISQGGKEEHLLQAKKRSVSAPKQRPQQHKRSRRLSAPPSKALTEPAVKSDQKNEWQSMQPDLLMIIVGTVAPQTASVMRLVDHFNAPSHSLKPLSAQHNERAGPNSQRPLQDEVLLAVKRYVFHKKGLPTAQWDADQHLP